MSLLELKNIKAKIEGEEKEILKGINLIVNPGEVHAIMGPNGSGKSTTSKAIMGYPGYEVTSGEIIYKNENINKLDTEERANKGIFLGFQHPVEIPGVRNFDFLHLIYNTQQKSQNKEELKEEEFKKLLHEKMEFLGLHSDIFTERYVNDGFSGGEKKRNEILQLALLDPDLIILDEIDSGLDIDALKMVSEGVNKVMQSSNQKGLILITHYQRLLNYIEPTHVHVLSNGEIVKSGDKSLVLELETSGYNKYI